MEKNSIYLCYDNNDEKFILKLKDILETKYKIFSYDHKNSNEDISNAINQSELFFLFLSNNSIKSTAILKEIEAYNLSKGENKNTHNNLYVFQLDDYFEANVAKELKVFLNQVTIKDYIDSNPDSLASAIDRIYEKYVVENSSEENTSKKSTYTMDEAEFNRLELQSEVSYWVDGDIYKELFDNYEKLNILDLGCSLGVQLQYRLKGIDNYFLIGVDNNHEAIMMAKNRYESKNSKYYEVDVLDGDFSNRLSEIMKNNSIGKFNVINISMLFAHFSYEQISLVLDELKKFLSDDGKIILNEYDDTFSWFSIDNGNEYITKLQEFMAIDTDTGAEPIGKIIYNLVANAGYKKIEFKKLGHPFFGCSKTDIDKIFDTEFSYVIKDIKKAVSENKGEKYEEALKWLNENFDKVRREFYRDDFLYCSGYLILIVGK